MIRSVDYRLQKLGTLPAVSRSIILQRCQQLRDGHAESLLQRLQGG